MELVLAMWMFRVVLWEGYDQGQRLQQHHYQPSIRWHGFITRKDDFLLVMPLWPFYFVSPCIAHRCILSHRIASRKIGRSSLCLLGSFARYYGLLEQVGVEGGTYRCYCHYNDVWRRQEWSSSQRAATHSDSRHDGNTQGKATDDCIMRSALHRDKIRWSPQATRIARWAHRILYDAIVVVHDMTWSW